MTGLEALNKIDNEVLYGVYAQEHYSNEIETIRKSLKALEIIKEKDVDLRTLKAYFKVECGLQEYNKHQYKENELTEEDFNLLKRYLNANRR